MPILIQSASCWIQGNVDIVSGYEISDTCSFVPQIQAETAVFFLGLIFVLGGIDSCLQIFFERKRFRRKTILGIVFVFTGMTYIIFSSSPLSSR